MMFPNWVDLIIVSLFLRAVYNAFGRGLLAELLSLAGALVVTSLTINWWHALAKRLAPYLWVGAEFATFLVFLGLVLFGILAVHLVVRKVSEVIKWERLHWTIQGLGMLAGGLRGLWWAGFLCVLLAHSGFDYLQRSVKNESILGPRALELAAEHIARVADLFPGTGARGPSLVPPIRTK